MYFHKKKKLEKKMKNIFPNIIYFSKSDLFVIALKWFTNNSTKVKNEMINNVFGEVSEGNSLWHEFQH